MCGRLNSSVRARTETDVKSNVQANQRASIRYFRANHFRVGISHSCPYYFITVIWSGWKGSVLFVEKRTREKESPRDEQIISLGPIVTPVLLGKARGWNVARLRLSRATGTCRALLFKWGE